MLEDMSNRNFRAVCCLATLFAGVVILWFVGTRADTDRENEKLRAATARVANIQAKLPDVREPVAAAAPPVDNRVAAEPEPVDGDVYKIVRERERNPVAAEDNWLSKRVRLRGKVVDIKSAGVATVRISEDGTLQFTAVCEVDRGSAALLKLNDPVVIVGRIKTIGYSHLSLDQCRFEQ